MVDVYTQTEVDALLANVKEKSCAVSGIQPASLSKNVGATWGKVFWQNLDFDTFPFFNTTVRCVVTNLTTRLPNGNFIIADDGIYDFSAQIYVSPPQNSNAVISLYLGLFDLGTNGLGSTLLAAANEDVRGGMHPSISLQRSLNIVLPNGTPRYYAFQWYFLDGAGVINTLSLQSDSIYCFASIEAENT
ncbi:MAG: hypothetical protein EBR82_48240 [Caulobacteraceae bacterium]|nr:hypothetical protein [Caulobacteraceae bacterium]